MTKPTLDSGFIQIACGKPENDVLTALAGANLNGTEYAIVLLVIRKTWGWKKNWDHISISQFQQIIGVSRRNIIRNVSQLVTKRLLVTKTSLGKVTEYSFNERFIEWTGDNNITSDKNVTGDNFDRTSDNFGMKLVTKTSPTKDNTKETNTKGNIKNKNKYTFDKNGNYSQPRSEGGISLVADVLKNKGLL